MTFQRWSLVAVPVLAGSVMFMAGCGSSPQLSGADELREQESREYGYLSEEKVRHFKDQLFKLREAMRTENAADQVSLRSNLASQAVRYRAALESGLRDKDSMRRRAIAGAMLGFTGDPRYANDLASVASDENEDSSVRLYAMAGLAELGSLINESGSRERIMPLIRKLLLPTASSAGLRVNAVTAYARAYSAARGDLLAPLTDAAAQDPDNQVRRQALLELGDIGDPSAVPSISSIALNDPSIDIRATAAVALGRIPDPQSLQALASAHGDPSATVRMQVVFALGAQQAIAPDQVVELVVDSLADFDDSVRRSAAITAGRLGDTRCTVPLLQTLSDRSDNVRLAALGSLSRVVTPERERDAFPVVGLLNDGDPIISTEAHRTLKRITGRAISASTDEWLKYYYVKYPELDPEVQYKDDPKPRFQQSSIRGGTRTGGTAVPRSTTTPRRNTQPQQQQRTQRNNNRMR